MKTSIISLLFATLCCASAAKADAPSWWNLNETHRFALQVNAAGVERHARVASIDLDFARLLSPAQAKEVNFGSVRVIEVSKDGNVLDDAVPFQVTAPAEKAGPHQLDL